MQGVHREATNGTLWKRSRELEYWFERGAIAAEDMLLAEQQRILDELRKEPGVLQCKTIKPGGTT